MTTQIPTPSHNGWAVAHKCAICGVEPVTYDLYGGKRCAEHPPSYDPQVAVRLAAGGFSDTAGAYTRNWPEETP